MDHFEDTVNIIYLLEIFPPRLQELKDIIELGV